MLHVCLHLLPFVGLVFDFITELDFYEYRPWQGIFLISFGISYVLWLLFLRHKNNVMIFAMASHNYFF